MPRILAALFALTLLSGCATPILKSDTVPVYSGTSPSTINIAVADHRPVILDGDKKEWFEGIMRGAFGIPHSLSRIDEFKETPFAIYLSTKLKDSLDGAGARASIVTIPKGTPVGQVIEKVKDTNAGASLVVMMFQSRYDIGPFNPEYGYNFELIVVDATGETLGRKTFQGMDQNMALSESYNLFDYMSEIYKKKFDIFLNDPEIKGALAAAAAGS